jgi:hypothetical protein
MIKVYADFNDKTPDEGYWILQHDGIDLAAKVSQLGLAIGDQVLLYQDEDDFEVVATLDFRFVDSIGRGSWVAFPDWTTVCRRPSGPSQAASGEPGRKVA